MNVALTSPGSSPSPQVATGSFRPGDVSTAFQGFGNPIAPKIVERVRSFDDPGTSRMDFTLLGKPHMVGLVDGGKVKLLHDMDFAEGANYLRHNAYCPEFQIWIDANLAPCQRKYKAFHEIMEVLYLLTRPGLGYEEAHQLALAQERIFRSMDAGLSPSP